MKGEIGILVFLAAPEEVLVHSFLPGSNNHTPSRNMGQEENERLSQV